MKLRNKKTGKITSTSRGEPIDLFITDDFNRIHHLTYSSLAELNEDWEDYTPKEPLIKDEKIRKAVRVWAEANDIGVVKFRAEEHRLFDKNVAIEFDAYFFEELQDGWNYAIAELCGEEE